MDGLFTGPPAERRRYLDRAVLSIDKRHGTRANAFEKAMRGRNRLLAEPGADAAWLDAIETEMAELGVAIAAARREWAALAVAMIGVTAPPLAVSGGRSGACRDFGGGAGGRGRRPGSRSTIVGCCAMNADAMPQPAAR